MKLKYIFLFTAITIGLPVAAMEHFQVIQDRPATTEKRPATASRKEERHRKYIRYQVQSATKRQAEHTETVTKTIKPKKCEDPGHTKLPSDFVSKGTPFASGQLDNIDQAEQEADLKAQVGLNKKADIKIFTKMAKEQFIFEDMELDELNQMIATSKVQVKALRAERDKLNAQLKESKAMLESSAKEREHAIMAGKKIAEVNPDSVVVGRLVLQQAQNASADFHSMELHEQEKKQILKNLNTNANETKLTLARISLCRTEKKKRRNRKHSAEIKEPNCCIIA